MPDIQSTNVDKGINNLRLQKFARGLLYTLSTITLAGALLTPTLLSGNVANASNPHPTSGTPNGHKGTPDDCVDCTNGDDKGKGKDKPVGNCDNNGEPNPTPCTPEAPTSVPASSATPRPSETPVIPSPSVTPKASETPNPEGTITPVPEGTATPTIVVSEAGKDGIPRYRVYLPMVLDRYVDEAVNDPVINSRPHQMVAI